MLEPPMTPELRAAFDQIFAHAMAQPVGALFDTEVVLRRLEAALPTDETVVAAAWRRFVVPIRERLLAAQAQSPRLLGAWLPEPARRAVADLLAVPVAIPRSWVKRVVTSPEFHAEVRHQLEESLRELTAEVFGKRGAGGLAAFARAGAAMGKGLFGGLGLDDRLRDAVSAALARLERRIIHLAASPKAAHRAGDLRRRVFLAVLEETEGEAVSVVRRIPHAAFDALVAPILLHNLARPEVRALLLAEARAFLQEIAPIPLGDLLRAVGLYENVQDLRDRL